MIDIANQYLDRGLRIVPVLHRQKIPAVTKWQKLIVTKENVSEYFKGGPHNIGVLVGEPSNYLADVDLDSEIARELAPYFLPKTKSVFGRCSRRRSHYEYHIEKEIYRKFSGLPQINGGTGPSSPSSCLVELRCKTGLQTVYPGSVHESGEPIEWDENGEPERTTADQLVQAITRLAIGTQIVPFWREGVRNQLALALSGYLAEHGFPLEDTDYLVKAIRRKANDEENRGREVRLTYERVRRGEPVSSERLLADLTSPGVVNSLNQCIARSSSSSPTQAKEQLSPRPLKVVPLSEIKAETVRWLWPGMIPKGFFTLADGPEGIGKTFLMLKLAEITSSGGVFPGSEIATKPGNVLLLSAEDSAAYVLKPRLEAMGAPCERIFVLDEPFTLDDRGFGRLTSLFEELSFDFVLIDPLFSFTGAINLNTDSEIRRVTDRLNRLAEGYDTAIAGIRHIGKSKGLGDARNAGLNGVGWRAGARSGLLIGHDPDDKSKRAIVQTKSNLSAESGISYGYEIDKDGGFRFTGKSDLTAEKMLSFKEALSVEEHSKIAEAVVFLEDYLTKGPRPSGSVYTAARSVGIAERTLQRAKKSLKVESRNESSKAGSWVWALPSDGRQTSKIRGEDRQTYQDGDLRPEAVNTGDSAPKGIERRQSVFLGEVRGYAAGKPYTKCSNCGKDTYVGRPCPYCKRSSDH